MIADEEKYQRLIRYNKIMITLVGVICVIISGYVFIEMKVIIIPLVLAVPIAVLIKIVLENISELRPLSVLMSDYRDWCWILDARFSLFSYLCLIFNARCGIRNRGLRLVEIYSPLEKGIKGVVFCELRVPSSEFLITYRYSLWFNKNITVK